jgi:hypothetical protein
MNTNPDCEETEDGRICADPYQDITDFDVFWHMYYDEKTKSDYDIALIKLNTPARLEQNNINTICLPFAPIEKPRDNEYLDGKLTTLNL